MKVPFFSQFTEEQIRKQVAYNAKSMREMHTKAITTGKKVGGFTAEQLDEIATRYEQML